jgi:hypothetical protein
VKFGVARPMHHAIADGDGYVNPVGHYSLC